MPIAVKLQSPEGTVIEALGDFKDVLHQTLPNFDDESFRLLNKIDWYADTEFEASQMGLLLEELERIRPKATGPEQLNYLQRLMQIASRCAATPGCKLRFIGD
jgi:hypothetical protein